MTHPPMAVPVIPAVFPRLTRLALALAASLVLLPAVASAQTLYGSVTGTIADDSGGSVPGVTVTLVNDGTAWRPAP